MFRLDTSSLRNAVHYNVTAALCRETIQAGLSSAFSVGCTSERHQVSDHGGRVEALGLIMVSSVLATICPDHLSSESSVYLKCCVYFYVFYLATLVWRREMYEYIGNFCSVKDRARIQKQLWGSYCCSIYPFLLLL
jgi:hypothetical protein